MQLKAGYRPRRPHEKSRNGCLTCKQRRIKCDESKPSCNQCQSSLRHCTYSPVVTSSGLDEPIAALSLQNLPGPSSIASSPSQTLESSLTESRRSTPTSFNIVQHGRGSEILNDVSSFSDSYLYSHFTEHACRYIQGKYEEPTELQYVTKVAEHSDTVHHSILALSAACLCCDMISQRNADPEIVRQGLSIGLQHHTIALEQMQSMVTEPNESNKESLLSNALLLFPFAFAFQHINHWVLCWDDSQKNRIFVTPRDAIVLLRGLKDTIKVLESKRTDVIQSPQSTTPILATSPPLNTSSSYRFARSHVMFPILAATSQQAFVKLQQRIDLASSSSPNIALSACSTTFEILSSLRTDTFLESEPIVSTSKYTTRFSPRPDSLLAQLPSWLRSYALRDPSPFRANQPLARTLFAFFFSAPQEYIDLLLPLLDQISDGSTGASKDQKLLANIEILALDIYSHWLVLLVLIEGESWWVRDFPILGLQGLIQKYDVGFSNAIQPEDERFGEKWWPASMLEIMKQVKQWR